MRRVVIPELLDSDSGTPEEIRDSLADLGTINRYLGGHRTTYSLLRRIAERTGTKTLTFLDVGGGSGHFAGTIGERLKRDGLQLRVTVLDRARSHFGKECTNGLLRIGGDALALPFRDDSYDVVGSNLFCHHLEPQQLTQFFNEALRVGRIGVLINDLRRNYFHLAATYLGIPFYRSRITRHDAPASVRRAYTTEELKSLLSRSTASKVTPKNYYFQRVGIIAWR